MESRKRAATHPSPREGVWEGEVAGGVAGAVEVPAHGERASLEAAGHIHLTGAGATVDRTVGCRQAGETLLQLPHTFASSRSD